MFFDFTVIVQGEVYPALMLFPAGRKDTVFYDGDMSVADVIKFICDHGSNSHHLMSDKGNFSSCVYFLTSYWDWHSYEGNWLTLITWMLPALECCSPLFYVLGFPHRILFLLAILSAIRYSSYGCEKNHLFLLLICML